MAGERFHLPAAGDLEPLNQGSLDGLCGLYSIINAIRLCCYPDVVLSTAELQLLFQQGMRYLEKRRRLPRLLVEGMSEKLWFKLSRHLFEVARSGTGHELQQSLLFASIRRFTRSAVISAIEGHVAQGFPVIIGLAGPLDHYSVISGFSLHRFYLFDSSGQRWVAKRCFGIDGGRPARLHWVTRTGAIAIGPR